MNVYALISLIAFMLCFFLGNFIYHKNPKSQLNIMVAILCLLVGFLAFTEFEYRQAPSYEIAYLWLKVSTLWPLVPSILLHISLIFTKKTDFLKNKLNYLLIYLPAVIITAMGLTTNLLINGALKEYWGWTYAIPTYPILFNIMAFWTLFAGFLAAYFCFSYYLRSKSIKRKQAKYIFVGLYIPLLISMLSDFILPNMFVRIPEMTMTMSTGGIGLISYGIWKYRFPALTPAIAADKIVSTMSNFFILLDTEKKIININQATNDLLGYNDSELIGKSIKLILAEDNIFDDKDHEVIKNEFISNVETNFKSKRGKIIPVFLSISLIQSEENEILGIVCIGSDIVDIMRAKDKIKASLHEKELLLQEVHHRVKNNLQIISSLLNLQSGYIKDKEDFELFKDSQSRVQSMAFIHEQLYQSSDFANIEFSKYIQNLLTYIQHYYVINHSTIELKIDVENIYLDINTAIPCGLIINELVTNSLKHAFPANSYKPTNSESTDIKEKVGEVYVGLHTYDNKYRLVVSDNGIGPPENFNFRNTDTLGLELVNNLVNQLDGKIKLDRNNGTKFEILFNKLEYKDRL